MLRFTDIVLANADDRNIAPIKVKAMVSDEPGFFLSPAIIQQLRLNPVITPQEIVRDGVPTVQLSSLRGPVRIRSGEQEITASAGTCESGIIIDTEIAKRLSIPVKPILEKQGDARHVLIKENALSPADCKKFCDYARSQELVAIGQNYRNTMMAPLKGIDQWVGEVIRAMSEQYIEPFYNLDIESWEIPQLLVYREGGVYNVHADGSHWVKDEDGSNGRWERFLDRDISFLLYFNEEFTGGKLDFPDINLKITPKPGLLVAFPSSHSYRHGAERTESGERLVLVTWMRAVGTKREWPKPMTRLMKTAYAERKTA